MKQTQQQKLLEALKIAPVNSYFATYNLRIKQAPTRVRELKEAGYQITSKTNPDRSVDWILFGAPKPIEPEVKRYEFVGNRAIEI